jgi:hypothetical protein
MSSTRNLPPHTHLEPHVFHTHAGKHCNIKTNTRVAQVESFRLSCTQRALQGGVELVTHACALNHTPTQHALAVTCSHVCLHLKSEEFTITQRELCPTEGMSCFDVSIPCNRMTAMHDARHCTSTNTRKQLNCWSCDASTSTCQKKLLVEEHGHIPTLMLCQSPSNLASHAKRANPPTSAVRGRVVDRASNEWHTPPALVFEWQPSCRVARKRRVRVCVCVVGWPSMKNLKEKRCNFFCMHIFKLANLSARS